MSKSSGLSFKTCNNPNISKSPSVTPVKSTIQTPTALNSIIRNKKGENPVCYHAEKGPRDYMEDTYQIMHFTVGNKKGTFYGVFDGHGGKDVSFQLVNGKEGLFPYLIAALKKYGGKNSIQEVLKRTYLEYDLKLYEKKFKAGSTAAVVLYYDDKLYTINLGDSRALVFIDKGNKDKTDVVKVTKDHKPNVITERNRIYKAGHFVNPFKMYETKTKQKYDNGDIHGDVAQGKYSIYLNNKWEDLTAAQYKQIVSLNKNADTPRVCNSLALSRAFGDFYLKVDPSGKYMAEKAAVSPEPDIEEINLKPYKGKMMYIFIASDGFWDVSKSTVGFRNELKSHANPPDLCKTLVKNALGKGSMDNTSVVFDRFVL
jgi:serine/threonine protein phosphatase PrpC